MTRERQRRGEAPADADSPAFTPPESEPPAESPEPRARRAEPAKLPLSQQKHRRRQRWAAWAQELPYLRLPPSRRDFMLIDRIAMHQVLAGADPRAIEAIEKDLDLLERDLMPYFRDLDRESSIQQNRYRLYQVAYIVLAMFATIVGSLIAIALRENPPRWVPLLAFLETVIALSTAFLATISGRESAMPTWLNNRRRAESLRREFFRFLMDLPPYDALEGYRRRMLLAERAALINRGDNPTDSVMPAAAIPAMPVAAPGAAGTAGASGAAQGGMVDGTP
jgi:hypothetical protein